MLPAVNYGGCGCGGSTSGTVATTGGLSPGGSSALLEFVPDVQPLPPVEITATRDAFPWWLWLLLAVVVIRAIRERR